MVVLFTALVAEVTQGADWISFLFLVKIVETLVTLWELFASI